MNLKSIQKPIFTSLLLALFDNYIKYLIRVNNVQENEIIQNVLTIDLTYNTGIAFGLLSEKTKITFFVSLVVLIWLILQFNKELFANNFLDGNMHKIPKSRYIYCRQSGLPSLEDI